MKNIKMYREQDQVMRFLMGLNDAYAMVRSQILMMEPFPSFSKVFSLVVQQERQNGLNVLDDGQVSVNMAERTTFYNQEKLASTHKYCTYCGRIGHTVETCQGTWFSTGIKAKGV
uniref:CCHC-type domain-containing protein n=1 Tax=Cajanus cajan TaxID=3821 RepID=A0A151U681_CAJCA|nr:hypothetical protein KK1_007460 [Cajanus cajan]